jgi:hypothetical protein
MVRRPALNAFAGRWRIVAMDVWSNDVLDLAEKAHISFDGTSGGEIAFVAVKGFLDVRYVSRNGATCASSHGRASMMPMKHAAVDGQRSAPMAASSAISSYIKATIQASPVNANDLFNSLLVVVRTSGKSARQVQELG